MFCDIKCNWNVIQSLNVRTMNFQSPKKSCCQQNTHQNQSLVKPWRILNQFMKFVLNGHTYVTKTCNKYQLPYSMPSIFSRILKMFTFSHFRRPLLNMNIASNTILNSIIWIRWSLCLYNSVDLIILTDSFNYNYCE